MKSFWENDGEPLPENHKHAGQFAAVIDLEDGSPPSIYYGKDHKEVADKLLVAQTNAANRIAELRKSVAAQPPDLAQPTPQIERRVLTADERMQIANDINDPAKAPEAIRRVMESEVGPLAAVRQRLSSDQEAEQLRAMAEEAEAFKESTSDWWPTEHNKRALLAHLRLNGWALTRKNFTLGFEALKEAGLIQFKPELEEAESASELEEQRTVAPAQEPTATRAQIRPRGTSAASGLRQTDASAASGARVAKKYTRAEIEFMSSEKFQNLFATDPEFRKFVESFDKPAAASR